ncbi:ATPase domain-containing protein [Halorientalis pallida]|uniref:non-specific serine/threonine protein kinase n=1 Tax=Halorientalis pallida TaxID=2479928 RepID=A0A498L2Q2_9EURY|nr:ATPase domain-containing protein [Halorientalis pallida]RXK50034.1 recombinase RecA [Halorientalis pallida]
MGTDSLSKITSGTSGLDRILHGGVPKGHTTIVYGGPGAGKTILALQFLAAGGNGLYVGFEEREQALRRNAEALGIDLSNVGMLDLSPKGEAFFSDDSYTVFPTAEVDGDDLLEQIASELETSDVDRLVVDPLSELRSLLPDDFQFRQKVSSLFNALTDRGVTTVCTAQSPDDAGDDDLQFLGNTVLELQRTTDRRTLEVSKYRGSAFASGIHTFRIDADTGAQVYPKLVPDDHHREHDRAQVPSDVPELDELLHGGIERGSVTVISGPSGVGKTTTGSQFLQAAAERGQRGLVYLFEELRSDYLYRATKLGMDLESLVEAGTLEIEAVEALTRSPDEFAAHVRDAVETRDVEFVMLDGIVGYRQGLRGDDSAAALTRELHAFCRYLKRMGVTVVLTEEVQYVTGEFSPTAHQISYLADNIIFLRYLETDGHLEKAIGVLKKRYGDFENALRTLSIDSDAGVRVGDPLSGYQGLLTGIAEPADQSDGDATWNG